jgi:uncharacterized iron-regulated membrane protein
MFANHGLYGDRFLGSLRGRSSRRRTPRRGLWVLLALVLFACLVVAAIFLWYSERPTETMTLTAVDRPVSAEPPVPPVSPARVRAVEELDKLLRGISRAHAGTHGVMLFDPYSGESRLPQRRPTLRDR